MNSLDGIEAREIAPELYWLGGCMQAPTASGSVHYHVSTYLVLGDERTALIDTGDPRHWATISRELDRVLGRRTLDYLFPTHPEIPHAGNLPALLETYSDAVVVGDVRDYAVHYPEHAHRLRPLAAGETVDLGGEQLQAVPAYIHDLPNTLWAYLPMRQTLFVSDGFSYVHDTPVDGDPEVDEPAHLPGQCRMLSSEMPRHPTVEQAAYGTGRALYWTRFVDVSSTFGEIERFLASHPTRLVAPAHGNVIDDVDTMLAVSLAAHRRVYQQSSTS